MKFFRTKELAEKWGVSDRRIRLLCEQKRIEGAYKQGKVWYVPADARKPKDKRIKNIKKIDEQYKVLFSRIDKKKADLNRKRPLTSGEARRISEEFMIEMTYNSNAIEGNTLTLQETAAILKENVTVDGKLLKEHLEAIGHKEAFLFVEQLVKDKIRFTENIVKQIHTLILMDRPEDKGVYRRIAVKILGANNKTSSPFQISYEMKRLFEWYNTIKKEKHPIEYISLFHLEFEGIHPFIDGNGRTGRLVMNLELMKMGYPNINVKVKDRRKYYQAFEDYFDKQDASAMINLVGSYVEEMLESYLAILL